MKKEAGTLTAADVEVAAASMKTAMDHLQEIGFNSAVEEKLLANKDAFLAYHPSDDDIQSLQQRLSSQGIPTDVSRVRSLVDLDYESRVQFLSLVEKQGLYKTELQLVEQFETEQLQYVSEKSPAVGLPMAQVKSQSGHLVRVVSYNSALSLGAAGVGLASGCTVTIFACEAAVVLCGACAISSC